MIKIREIKMDKDYLNGNPYLDGFKLTVHDIVSHCFYEGIDSFKQCYPNITLDELMRVLNYCSIKSCVIGNSYCGGCSLRLEQDEIFSEIDFINRFNKIKFTETNEEIIGNGKGVMVMLGCKDDFPNLWRGDDGWMLAKNILDKRK